MPSLVVTELLELCRIFCVACREAAKAGLFSWLRTMIRLPRAREPAARLHFSFQAGALHMMAILIRLHLVCQTRNLLKNCEG